MSRVLESAKKAVDCLEFKINSVSTSEMKEKKESLHRDDRVFHLCVWLHELVYILEYTVGPKVSVVDCWSSRGGD